MICLGIRMSNFWLRVERIPPTIILFLFFFSIYAGTMSGVVQYGDEIEKYRVAQSIVDRQEFAFRPTAQRSEIGSDGRTYSIYELGQTVFQIPLYVLARLVNHFFPQPDVNRIGFLIVGFLNPLLTALTAVLFFKTCQLFFRFRTCLALTVVFGLATIAWPYSRNYTREPLMTLLLLLSFYAAERFRQTRSNRWLLALGIATGYLTFTKLIQGTAVLIFLGYALFWIYQERRRAGLTISQALGTILPRAALFLMPVALLLGVQGLYAWSRFGTFYSGLGGTKSNPMDWILFLIPMSEPLAAIVGLLFSSEKSVFLYSLPALLFLIAWFKWFHRERGAALVVLALVLVAFGTAISRPDWEGGTWWGPRYLVQITPLLILPIGVLEAEPAGARRRWKAALLALSVAGMLVSALGAFSSERDYMDVTGYGTALIAQVDFLRHGVIDSLVLYLSPTGFPIRINFYGVVLAGVMLLSGLVIVRALRTQSPTATSTRLGVAVLALVLLVQSIAFILWIVIPYQQVFAQKANTLFVAGNAFLADGRPCEATAMYLMAIERGTTFQSDAKARLEKLLPRARGMPILAGAMMAEQEKPDEVQVEQDRAVTISGNGALKIHAPQDLGNVSARIQAEPIPVLPNTLYELSGWIRAENVYGKGYGSLTISEDDGTLHHIRSMDVVNWDETIGWMRFQKTFTTLPTTQRLFVAAWLWKTPGTVWVDGLQLARITPQNPPSAQVQRCPPPFPLKPPWPMRNSPYP